MRSKRDQNPSAEDSLVVVTGSDDCYAIGLAVTLSTMLSRLPGSSPVRLVILDGGMSDESRARIERVVSASGVSPSVDWHRPDLDRLQGLRRTRWGSASNYLRLLVPELLDEADRWALYLDSDLLVRGDVLQLWRYRHDASDFPVHAVGAFGVARLRNSFDEEFCRRHGLDADAPCFNSGVLMMDLGAWRADRISDRAMEFARNHGGVMHLSDQDALNAVINGKWGRLADEWNVLLRSVDALAKRRTQHPGQARQLRAQLLREGRILHFAGPFKPWLPDYWGPHRALYIDALRRSGWFASGREYRRWRRKYVAGVPRGLARHFVRRSKTMTARTLERTPVLKRLLT